jgi:hypothetical protein
MTFDEMPSIDDSSLGTSLRGERRDGRPFRKTQRDRQQESIACHRPIHPRGITRHVLDRFPRRTNEDHRAIGAKHLDEPRQFGF